MIQHLQNPLYVKIIGVLVAGGQRSARGREGGQGSMSEFRTVLRGQVEHAQAAVQSAWRFGNDERARLYGARVAELLEVAARHGVDTAGWVEPAVRAFAVDAR
ncbi:hypothetical protein BKA01_003092 [Pseudonocardia eucalypti]|uniref:hypothetical protein n=1 Tax=Pseudonocardia eucalypti TaxID=648755 RepID=UPI00160F2D97|nr:hypothetical protein [Pseudonocardia eucalypti]